MQNTLLYPSDLTGEQWAIIRTMIPQPQNVGRPPRCRRQILNGILYAVRSGCAWRLLPRDFGPWKTVYEYFRAWRKAGIWDQIHAVLRDMVRIQAGKKTTPTAAILDSQSVKTANHGGVRGFDAGKKIQGRKRHILVDTLGMILVVMVTPANFQDRDAACSLLTQLNHSFCRLRCIWADGGYAGRLVEWLWYLRAQRRIRLAIVKRSDKPGFHVLPKRWIVERTFAWLLNSRRLRCDYERNISHSQAMIHIAMISLMLKRLAKSST